MSKRALELGIKAVQMGSAVEGARLLRYALKRDAQDRALDGDQRATAYIWLAETSSDATYKRGCYAQAAATARDPNLAADARARMEATLAAPKLTPQAQAVAATNLTPVPVELRSPMSSPAPMWRGGEVAPVATNANIALCVARIIDGANGAGTAIYVDGLWATSRRVIGGLERVTVELHGREPLSAVVVRSSPDLDIALLAIEHTPPSAPLPADLPPDTEVPLVAISFDGQQTRGTVRPTRRTMPEHWIPTDFTMLPDAGGDPLFDPQNRFVGIATRNTARNADHFFGVTTSAIRELVAAVLRQMATDARAYCHRAGAAAGRWRRATSTAKSAVR
ncbi:MAG: serine protease [Chloroflexota bacterium]|nr:serine protease [Chloroflexota bacterium]